MKDAKESKETKEVKEIKETNYSKEAKDTKDAKENNDAKPTKTVGMSVLCFLLGRNQGRSEDRCCQGGRGDASGRRSDS